MTVLIDYFNLSNNLKEKPLQELFGLFLNSVPVSLFEIDRNISFRLYGGWFEQNKITRKAQELAIEIEKAFPSVYYKKDSQNKYIINCELAYSLICVPNYHLFYTYRTRGVYYGLKVKSSKEIGCTEIDCPYDLLQSLLKSNKCPKCDRPNAQSNFFRNEQKLIDSMIASDLIFLSLQGLIILLISSDDDIYPAVLTGLNLGGLIIHFEAKKNQKEFDYRSILASHKNYFYFILNNETDEPNRI